MQTYIMPAEKLNLPKPLAKKFRGQKIELVERKSSVLLKPIEDLSDVTDELCGMIKTDGTWVEKFLKENREEEGDDLQYGREIHI